MLILALIALAAYLLGAIPFGYLVARARGVDILHAGSGNIGATNVGRVLGRPWGILVFVLDFAKGALPVGFAGVIASDDPSLAQVLAGVATFLGHLFPVYLGFRGGKGVATGAGVVSLLVPGPALAAILAWLVVASTTRYVSAASVVAALVLCAARLTSAHPWTGSRAIVTGFCVLAASLVVIRHRANLLRLANGNENRLRESLFMMTLNKILHAGAVSLWFGTVVFFTLMGLVVFGTFERISELPASERPAWLPLPPVYDQARPSPKLPEPLRKEQGSRVAGAVVGPLFDYFFGIQIFTSAMTAVTAWGWLRQPGRVHRLRVALATLALVTVWLGWWLDGVVEKLREPRNELTNAVLMHGLDGTVSAEGIAQMEAARASFGLWHGFSLLANFATLGLVAGLVGCLALLPGNPSLALDPSRTKMNSSRLPV